MNQYRSVVVADHHKTVIVCRILDTQTGETQLKTLSATRTELHALLTDLAGPVVMFVEACRSWEWVSDLCEDDGVDMRLVDAAKMPEIWRSTKKTDRGDVEAMMNRWLVMGCLPEAYRATRGQRELRGLTRRLEELRKHRRNSLNRIHALIDAQGIPARKELFFEEAWLASAEQLLPADAWLVLQTLLRELGVLVELQRTIEKRVGELLASREDAKRLREIPGVGPIIAATIVAETADISRFGSARAFAAYTGLVPRVRSSAARPSSGTSRAVVRLDSDGLSGTPSLPVFEARSRVRCRASTDERPRRASPRKSPCALQPTSSPESST